MILCSKLQNFIKLPYIEKKITLRKKILPVFKKSYGSYGRNSDIYKPIMVYNKKHIFIGNNVIVRNGARIEAVVNWNGIKYTPELILEDGVTCEQNLHIISAKKVLIKKGVTIAPNVMIMDNEHSHKDHDVKILEQVLDVKETIVGEDSFLGKNVCVMPGVRIGRGCVIGANAVVTKDIPDYSIAVGVPAKVIKTIR